MAKKNTTMSFAVSTIAHKCDELSRHTDRQKCHSTSGVLQCVAWEYKHL